MRSGQMKMKSDDNLKGDADNHNDNEKHDAWNEI
jgi:hypothetical protein